MSKNKKEEKQCSKYDDLFEQKHTILAQFSCNSSEKRDRKLYSISNAIFLDGNGWKKKYSRGKVK